MTMIRIRASLSAAFAMLLLSPLHAQTVTLDFEPPEMAASPVCIPRAADADLIAEWGAWDHVTLPDRDIGLINRDMRRLSELDPTRWDAIIEAVTAMLPSVSPSFTEDHVTLARIEHLIALGNLQELKTERLVQKLLDRGDANSPRMLNALAGFLSTGVGVERDIPRGEELLMAAGYGGNADALLILARLSVEGKAPKGWDVNPQLAVTMAFGSLVGQIDPLICDRISRIAREYSSGEIVTLNHDLALRWYRFAADLGDPIAAWRVAEYELQSELVIKDNSVLMTYLAKAAAGGLPYAQVTLGRVYEAGALAPVDVPRARTLYETAAAQGDRAALIRLSGFLESQLPLDPGLLPQFLDTLVRLEALEDPPAWVFAKHAVQVEAAQGRWAVQEEVRALLEKGAALDDPTAIVMLANVKFGAAHSEAAFYTAVDRLIYSVTALGEAGPATDLQAAFLCKAPKAPMLSEAAYWADAEAAIGSSSLLFTGPELAALVDDPDPLVMAALQTQALYGRATPIANLLDVLEKSGAPASSVEFWASYGKRFASVDTARATLALGSATTIATRAAALDQFRAGVALGDQRAALKLAKALLAEGTEPSRVEAVALLARLAQDGMGEAMALLPAAEPMKYPTLKAVYDAYARQIEQRGDFHAILLALPFLPDPARQETYRARAVTAMACTFPEALSFATASDSLGNEAEARRWLTIATHLAVEDPWQLVELGDSYNALLEQDGEATALAFYDKAHALGSRTAVQRLLRINGTPSTAGYDQSKAITLYADLVSLSTAEEIPAVLAELGRKDATLRLAVESRLDLDQIYADAAAAGSPAAMREHAIRLRAAAATSEDVANSTIWLIRASEGGDTAAMVMLAQAYSLGVGVPASLEKAREWLAMASAAGDPTASEMIRFIETGAGSN